jgi:7-carboxy-7-deazaguanine synthase
MALLAETFVSLQGEGPLLGQRAAFVRLSRCKLTCGDCGRFIFRSESRRCTVSQVAAWLTDQRAELLIVTGCEPLQQQSALAELARSVGTSVRILVETNGTITPTHEVAELVDIFVVSPKLAGSGVPRSVRIAPETVTALVATGKAQWKFVATTISELDEIAELAEGFALRPVWITPQGTTPADVLDAQRRLAEAVLRRGWNLSTRLHILLWGDERGL